MPSRPIIAWKCPRCQFEWSSVGEGVPGHRYAKCPTCGYEVPENENPYWATRS